MQRETKRDILPWMGGKVLSRGIISVALYKMANPMGFTLETDLNRNILLL
jgi:hypothetical protein